jgi:hypothetical protein
VIPELSDFSVSQEEWRRQITKTTIHACFPSPNLWLSKVSLQDSHLAKGRDLVKVLRDRCRKRALFTQATFAGFTQATLAGCHALDWFSRDSRERKIERERKRVHLSRRLTPKRERERERERETDQQQQQTMD